MKKILIGIAVVLVVIVGAAVVAPLFVPLDTVRDQIVAQVEAATGRDFTIDGDIHLSVLPSAEIDIDGMRLANAPGGEADSMVRLGGLRVELRLLPLLTGAVEIARFVLVDPVINLEVDADGRANWVFAAQEGAGGTAPAAESAAPPSSGAPAAADGEGGGFALNDLKLGDVRIENGTLSYRDARGARYKVEKIDMALKLASLASPLAADGALTFNGKRLTIEAVAETPARLLAGERAALRLSVAGEPLRLTFEGGATAADAASLEGSVDLSVPSVRDLAAWAGAPLDAPGSGLGPLAIKGKLAADPTRIAFSDATLALDAIKGSGAVSVALGGARPRIQGKLALGVLDLNPYLPPEEAEGEGAAAPASAAAPAQPGQDGAPPPSDWSDAPIDLSGLRALDADLAFSAEGIRFRKITIGRSVVAVALEGGDLRVDLKELALYGGSGAARLRVDARGDVPAIEKTLRLAGVQAEPLLRDAAGFDRLSGTAEARIAIKTRGRSEREMVSALAGEGAVTFRDGTIKGINLAAMIRNVKTAFTGGAQEAQKTDFAELAGSFRIVKGVLRNDDLRLLAPLIRVAGAGTVDLPRRRVDYRIEPKLAATTEGQGGQADVAGLMVPVVVTGPWDGLSYRPDLSGLVGDVAKNPEALLKAGKNVGKGLKGGVKGVIGEIVGGAAGGASGDAAGGASGGGQESPAPANPLKTLKNLFGGN